MTATYTGEIRAKGGRRALFTTNGHPDHETAARKVFEMAGAKHRECTTFRGMGMDIRFHRRTAGQVAYETELRAIPNYHDGTPRKAWRDLSDVERLSWERNPTPRT